MQQGLSLFLFVQFGTIFVISETSWQNTSLTNLQISSSIGNHKVTQPTRSSSDHKSQFVEATKKSVPHKVLIGSSVTVSASLRNRGARPRRNTGMIDISEIKRYENRSRILVELKKVITEEFQTDVKQEATFWKKKADCFYSVARELEFQSEELRCRAYEQTKLIRRKAELMREQVEDQVEYLRTQADMIRAQAEEQSAIIRQQAEEIRKVSGSEYEHLIAIASNIEQQGRKQVGIVRQHASQLRVNLRDKIEVMKLQEEAQAAQMELQADQLREQAAIFRMQAVSLLEPADQMLRSLEALTELVQHA